MPQLVHARFRTPVGSLLAVARGDRLCRLEFEKASPRPRPLGRATPPAGANSLILDRVALWLERYFARAFDELPEVALETPAGTLDAQVRDCLRMIPLGHAITLEELAARLGKPRALRTVGAALRRLPIALLVPSHRVAGTLCAHRAWLLAHEGAEPEPPYRRIQRVPGRSSSGKNSRTSWAEDR